MAPIDTFASSLLEEAKRFFELASEDVGDEGRAAYLHASLMLAFCALEAHVFAVSEDFAEESIFSPHELGLLQEKVVGLEDGEFKVTAKLQMVRLGDRIQFLYRKFANSPIDKTETWWSELKAAIDLRNELTHPKGVPNITLEAVQRAIQAIIDVLDAVYRAVYQRRFPAAGRGLNSRLSF